MMYKNHDLNLINKVKDMYLNDNIPYKDIIKKLKISKDNASLYVNQTYRFINKPSVVFEKIKEFNHYNELVKFIKERLRKKNTKIMKSAYEHFSVYYDKSYLTPRSFRKIYSVASRYAYNELETHVPLLHMPGYVQLDFGYCSCYYEKRLHTMILMVITFPYSNYSFFQILKIKNSITMIRSLDTMFKYINKYPLGITCDNDVSIIHKQKVISNLEDYCKSNSINLTFCNISKPNEKVHVENAIRKIRLNVLTPPPIIDDLNKYNQFVLKNSFQV